MENENKIRAKIIKFIEHYSEKLDIPMKDLSMYIDTDNNNDIVFEELAMRNGQLVMDEVERINII